MGKPISSVTIVGGGTSGWLAATALSRFAQSDVRAGRLKITLIESPKIPIIGVGEATSPALPHLFKMIGLNERSFIKEANVGFKLSGYFDGWNRCADGAPRVWVNPFMQTNTIDGRCAGYYYTQFESAARNAGADYSAFVSSSPKMIDLGRGPRLADTRDYETIIPYAYHMDALVLAKTLCAAGKTLGVHHILDDVVKVDLDERGYVSSLDLKEHGLHAVEFIIDCTGFAGVIINKTLGEPFEPFDKYLPNDRAAVMQIPHKDPTKIAPITRATAKENGWIFNVPLFNRIGTGYVYASQFISDEEACAVLKAHVGEQGEGKDPRIIPMRIGKSRRSWVNNCVAIGLSSGFVEPLEATAIHSVDLALRWLYTHFPDSDFDPALRDRYNRLVDDFYEEVIDFIVLHFHLSNRDDSEYWRVARHERPIPDSLADNLALWRCKMPRATDLRSAHFFSDGSYLAALFGKGFYDDAAPELPGLEEAQWRAFQNSISGQIQQLSARLPDHYPLLCAIRGEPPAGNPPPETDAPARFNISLN